MDYKITYEDTPVGRHRYEETLRAVLTRAGASGEKDTTTFEDQKKEARILRAHRKIGKPKDWISEIRKQMNDTDDQRQKDALQKLLEKFERGEDPRVAEPEAGMPETRDFVLQDDGGTIVLNFEDRELVVKRLKDTKWMPAWAGFGQDLVEMIAGVAGVTEDEPSVPKKLREVKGSKG